MGNSTASLMLLLWPVVAFFLFKKLPVGRAILWTIVGGYLLLPPRQANFDLPLLPPLDKILIPNLLAAAGVLYVARQRIAWVPASVLMGLVMLVFVFSSVPTVLSNGDPLALRAITLPGLRTQDVISAAGTQLILLLPLILGRQFLATDAAQRDILIVLLIAGLAYSIPAAAEVRLAPFMNEWIYGWFQHDFIQMMRYGGFRPIVFLPHAIWLAVFMMFALVACATLLRESKGQMRLKLALALAYLIGILIICKTLGPILYAALAVPLVLFLPVKWRVHLALVLAVVAVCYPLLRGADMVPTGAIVGQVGKIDGERAHSLNYRFENEEALLEHAEKRPWFGWGGWGRNLLYDEQTGEALTISDGRWIIVFGIYGWVGFLAEFLLLAIPLFLLWSRVVRDGHGGLSPYAATVALLLGFNLFDLLPNAPLEPITWLLAGAVLGQAERARNAIDYQSTPVFPLPLHSRTILGRAIWPVSPGTPRRSTILTPGRPKISDGGAVEEPRRDPRLGPPKLLPRE